MARRILPFLLLIALGCARDPATAPLRAGDVVLLHDDGRTSVYLDTDQKVSTDPLSLDLAVGTKLRVAADPPADPEGKLTLYVLEGPREGSSVRARRAQLRPAR